MKVAFASTNGRVINRPFGMADRFFVWEVDRDAAACVARVSARALASCLLVCTSDIGGHAAVNFLERRIQPMKAATDAPIIEVVKKLQRALDAFPPPLSPQAPAEEELG